MGAGMSASIKLVIKRTRDKILEALPTRTALSIEFLLYQGRFPRLDNPVTFNEKIQHRKLFDRDPRLTEFSDKILAKERVAAVLGPEWIIPTIWSGTALPPRPERTWPIPYVLKASHGSGWNLFIRSREDENWPDIERTTAFWLKQRYGLPSKEWAYWNIQPRLLVEPYLDHVATTPNDYKFWVFGGKVAYIQVDTDRYRNHRQYFYDRSWTRQSIEYAAPGTPEDVPQPQSLDKMIWAAERLGAGFSFARVDLYEVDYKPLFGELTFYPNSARARFKSKNTDTELGRLWKLPPAAGSK
jgi:hypothetical protein